MFCRLPLLSLLSLIGAGGCVNTLDVPAAVDVGLGTSDAQKPEVWSAQDAPTMFSSDLNYTLSALPAQGEAARIPWAGSYWPVYEDGINRAWKAGEDSPAAKYGKAFNVVGVDDAVSRANGIDSQSNRTACTTATAATACKSELSEECAIRPGRTEGRCIPTWFGICHAWAPAAIMIPEPEHDVVQNGVTFRVNDLKALASLVHEGVQNKFVSLRCELDDRSGATNGVTFDDNGRPIQSECRDSNAGSFHVLLTNYLGIKHASFVFDRTLDDEVWNQPLRGYRVLESRTVTVADANRLMGVIDSGTGTTGTATTTALTATIAQGAWQHFAPIAVTAGNIFKVVMSGSGDGDLYVQFGAQATTTTFACRPFADGSAETCELTVPVGSTQAFVSVNGYTPSIVQLQVSSGTGPTTAPTTAERWRFNDKAKTLQYVKVDVQYVGESATETDGNLSSQINRFTHTDRYEYILELDGAGAIIGGEWVGASKRVHPDFAWLPVRVTQTSVAGGKIRYADVKSLLDEAVATNAGGGNSTLKTQTQSGTITKNEWRQFGPFTMAAATNLMATMTGSGDADLYVKAGQAPTASTYDCRPYQDGTDESCSVIGNGPVFVAVNGYAVSSDFSLSITWTGSDHGGAPVTPPMPPTPTTPTTPTTTQLNVTGQLALNAWAYHTINVVAGTPLVIRTTAARDVDVYVQMGVNPTATNAVARAYTDSGNELLRFVPTSSGVLHIGVHGYQASGYTLTTAAQ